MDDFSEPPLVKHSPERIVPNKEPFEQRLPRNERNEETTDKRLMRSIVVVNHLEDWPLQDLEVELVTAREYLKGEYYEKHRNLRVINLCRSYAYQRLGFYVSLVATARGHKPQPDLLCIEDMKSSTFIRFISKELDELIQHSLKRIRSDQFELSIYFGTNTAKRYDKLANYLWRAVPSPFLQAKFVHLKDRWVLANVNPLSLEKIPPGHLSFAAEQTMRALHSRRPTTRRKSRNGRYDLAILVNQEDSTPPSDSAALQKFCKAAERVGLVPELIGKRDIGRIPEFDALFIRETTRVNHHTYRFARFATANGLVVIDDPLSILRCGNKVFLMEMLQRHRLPTPESKMVDRENYKKIAAVSQFPVVLKQPDGCCSRGVTKVDTPEEFLAEAQRLFEKSDLILVQEFMPSDFDWRVGVFDGKPIYACRYYMAEGHWQIYKKMENGELEPGNADSVSLDQAPPKLLDLAVKATSLIGNSLYGVDIKEINGRFYVIEVNDNPNIDSGVEDEILGDKLYEDIMQVICQRIEAIKSPVANVRT